MSTHTTLPPSGGSPSDLPIEHHRHWTLRVIRIWRQATVERWQAEAYLAPSVPPPAGLADWTLFTQANTPAAALAMLRAECDRFDEAYPELVAADPLPAPPPLLPAAEPVEGQPPPRHRLTALDLLGRPSGRGRR